MDLSLLLSESSAPFWAAVSAVLSALGTWRLSVSRNAAFMERTRIKASAESIAAEASERAAFRATLMTELAAMRLMAKECETDRSILRERLNSAEGQILILKASNEIMERWVAFFKDRAISNGRPGAPDGVQ